jgi:chemotaxis protein methyltransferase CheR
LLTRILPDLQSWHISILGTDINPQFLKKAEKGVYDPWSFRIVSPSIKERFFTHVHGKYEISAAIKKMVRFERMNLVDEKPPQGLILSSMDIIFCRNVLMYFDPDQAVRVLNRLHNALSDEGVLISTPFEFSALPENPFERLPHHGAVLLKKRQIQRAFYGAGEPPGAPVPLIGTSRPDTLDPQISISLPFAYAPAVPEKKLEREESRLAPALVDEARHARLLFEAGKYAECISHLLPICSDKNTSASLTYLLARAYCDRGDLPDALTWIDRAIELDRLNHCAYFTRATILEALGRIQESLKALRQALFLEPEFVVAEFYMASLLLRLGKLQESRKRFLGALSLLAQYNDDDLVPESEGITAGRLSQIIKSLLKETAT